ncbi:MAG: hypothetical protein Q8O40_11145 [Chloroflexota bacterium]|nr:hypothetical protein [Chloroflexota bacterium]
MKRWTWLAILGAASLIAVALFATTVFAQGPRGWMAAPSSAVTADVEDGDWDCPMHDGSDASGYDMMGGGSGMMGAGYGMGLADQVTLTRVAGVLGISADDLVAQLKDGKTVAQVAEAKGVSLDTVVSTILAPRAEALKARVTDGYLTQEQADSILAQAAQRVEQMLTVVHPGLTGQNPATGQSNGRGGMMGGASSGGMMGGGYGRGGTMGGGFGGGMMGGGSSGGMMGW